MFGLYKSWRFRNGVQAALERLYASNGQPQVLIRLIKKHFGQGYYDAIEAVRRGGQSPNQAAVYLALEFVPVFATVVSPDQRELTLFALIKGNEADPVANNLFYTIREVRRVAGSEYADEMFVKMVGAFNGLTDQALERFVSDRMPEFQRTRQF